MHRNQNPILKKIEEGDIVLMRMPRKYQADAINLVRLSNLDFTPAGEGEFDFDWLEFDADVLWTNTRMHKDFVDRGICNCLGITEIVPEELVDNYVQRWNMFDPEKYMISEEEAEQNAQRAKREFGML